MSSLSARYRYLRRVGAAYLGRGQSQLSFWHEHPEVNGAAGFQALGPYYMTFSDKAKYTRPFDEDGIPLLDYRGALGLQYNPIAIAQYGLAHYNRLDEVPSSEDTFLRTARYLRDSLRQNDRGRWVWMHLFDWEYRDRLRPPWYSGLAQGQGISLLVRAHHVTSEESFAESATKAYEALVAQVEDGGTVYLDDKGHPWIEEYIVDPPTHILNGFLWALWGGVRLSPCYGRQGCSAVLRCMRGNAALTS